MFDKNQKTLINVFAYFLSTIAKKLIFAGGTEHLARYPSNFDIFQILLFFLRYKVLHYLATHYTTL